MCSWEKKISLFFCLHLVFYIRLNVKKAQILNAFELKKRGMHVVQPVPKLIMLLFYPRHFQSLPMADIIKSRVTNLGVQEGSHSGHNIVYHRFTNQSSQLKAHFLQKLSEFNVETSYLPLNPWRCMCTYTMLYNECWVFHVANTLYNVIGVLKYIQNYLWTETIFWSPFLYLIICANTLEHSRYLTTI